MRYASCTITWKFKYIPYPDLLTDLSEKYIRLVVHRVRVSDSGTNYSKFSQEAVKRGVHSLHKEVPLWLGIVDGINNSTHCMLLCPTPPSNIMTTSLLRTGGFAPVNFLSLSHNCIALPHINARMARKCKNSPNSKKMQKKKIPKKIKLIHGQG